MSSIIVNGYLIWGAWQDLRERKISNKYLWTGGIIGFIFKGISLAAGVASVQDWLLALIPGTMILILAKVTGEKIGSGDGWVLMILGSFITGSEVWKILQAATVFVMLCSVVLLCSRRVSKEYQIPFLPFLWIAHTFLWGLGYA